MDPGTLENYFWSAELGSAAAVLDLHDDPDAINSIFRVEEFLNQAFFRNQSRDFIVAKIIHGRGTGKLKSAIQKLLSDKKRLPFIAAFRNSTLPHETGAVTYVILQPNSKLTKNSQ